MINKKVKIINWLCLVLSALALILECMPKSMELKYIIQPGKYMYSYWSYFGNPLDPTFFMAWVVIICTVTTLLLNIIALFKDKRGICIASMVLQSLAAVFGVIIVATAYNVIISAICRILIVAFNVKLKVAYQDIGKLKKSAQIFLTAVSFIMLIGSVVMFNLAINLYEYKVVAVSVTTMIVVFAQFIIHCNYLKGDKAQNKKIATINWISLITMIATVFLETLSKSMRYGYIENHFGEDVAVTYENSYLAGTGDWSVILTTLIVISTTIALLFDIVTMIVDKKPICIIALVLGALASVCNITLIIWYWRFVNVFMILIMILLIIQVITLSVKLKFNAWIKKINTEHMENAPI